MRLCHHIASSPTPPALKLKRNVSAVKRGVVGGTKGEMKKVLPRGCTVKL